MLYEISVFVKLIQRSTWLRQMYQFYKNHSAAFVLRSKNNKRIPSNFKILKYFKSLRYTKKNAQNSQVFLVCLILLSAKMQRYSIFSPFLKEIHQKKFFTIILLHQKLFPLRISFLIVVNLKINAYFFTFNMRKSQKHNSSFGRYSNIERKIIVSVCLT